MSAIVETRDLTRAYGATLALDHLTLTIPDGAIYGLIGPNGAGKTTTMRILTTLLRPSGGEAWVAGIPVARDPRGVRRMVGFMPDYFGVYDSMRTWEYLDFFGRANGVAADRRARVIPEVLELVDLGYKRDDFVMGLSRGMKQRLSLARTMIHDPKLLILDEPASGLDPRARIELRELLKELRALGKTIMISSHILTELAEMCTHIAIVERGRLLASGSVDEIMRSLQPHRTLEIRLLEGLAQATALLNDHPHVLSVREEASQNQEPGTAEPQNQESQNQESGTAEPQNQESQNQESGTAEPQNQESQNPIARRFSAGDAQNPGSEPSNAVAPSTQRSPFTVLLVDHTGDERAQAELLASLVSAGVVIIRFAEQQSDLEDIFMQVTRGLVQ